MDEYFKYNSVIFISRKIPKKKMVHLNGLRRIFLNDKQIELNSRNQDFEKLKSSYMDSIAIQGFDPDVDSNVPDGCYAIEKMQTIFFVGIA